MAINLEELATKLADDMEIPLGEDGTIKGADLKSWLTENKKQLGGRETQLAESQKEIERLRKYEADTSKLFETAARLAGQEDAAAQAARAAAPPVNSGSPVDDDFAEFERDPLFGQYSKKFSAKMMRDIQSGLFAPWVEKELKPQFEAINRNHQILTNALLEERQSRTYREAGDWPEGYDMRKVVEHGREKKFFVPGGEQFGLVDIRRVHDDVMGPINRQKEIDRIRQEAKEEALREFRQGANVIQLPNREMGGGRKPVAAKGRTPDEIFSNAMTEAANDLQTQRMIMGIKG